MNVLDRTMRTALAALALTTIPLSPLAAAPLGNAFSYQGQLIERGQPGNGRYDLRFSLFPAATGGTAIGPPVTNVNVLVSNGLFTTAVDLGAKIFNGDEYWLDLGVRPG